MFRKNCARVLNALNFAALVLCVSAFSMSAPARLAAEPAPTPVSAPATPLSNGVTPLLASLSRPLVARERAPAQVTGPSLFAGRMEGSLFEPIPERIPDVPEALDKLVMFQGPSSDVDRIRDIIGRAESHREGYDAVQHGAKIKPKKRPTDMTIADIYDWIVATPGQPHAIGRYQFIPKTLTRLVIATGTPESAQFTPEIQDRLSDQLLLEAGLMEARAGRLPRHAFMNNLAKIWAGLPNSTGKSHYHGFAGNKASITWAEFDREMKHVFKG